MAKTATVAKTTAEDECELASRRIEEYLMRAYLPARKSYGNAKATERVIVTNTVVGTNSLASGCAAQMVPELSELGVEADSPIETSKPLVLAALRAYVKNGGTLKEWIYVIVGIQSINGHRFGSWSVEFDSQMLSP